MGKKVYPGSPYPFSHSPFPSFPIHLSHLSFCPNSRFTRRFKCPILPALQSPKEYSRENFQSRPKITSCCV
jgi:hypothetical protein